MTLRVSGTSPGTLSSFTSDLVGASVNIHPMGDAEEADYDTSLSGEQTQLAPSESGTEAHTAWALDDGEDIPAGRRFSPGQITAVAVSAAVLLAAGAGVVAWQHLNRDQGVAAPVVTPEAPTTTTKRGWGGPAINRPPVQLPPPPPSTVTVTKEPPVITQQVAAPPPPIDMRQFDGLFIQNMKAQGWVIWNEAQSVETARMACSMLHNGATFQFVANHLAVQSQAKIEEGQVFTSTAMRTYPNCP